MQCSQNCVVAPQLPRAVMNPTCALPVSTTVPRMERRAPAPWTPATTRRAAPVSSRHSRALPFACSRVISQDGTAGSVLRGSPCHSHSLTRAHSLACSECFEWHVRVTPAIAAWTTGDCTAACTTGEKKTRTCTRVEGTATADSTCWVDCMLTQTGTSGGSYGSLQYDGRTTNSLIGQGKNAMLYCVNGGVSTQAICPLLAIPRSVLTDCCS
jgi:hypothetical protein